MLLRRNAIKYKIFKEIHESITTIFDVLYPVNLPFILFGYSHINPFINLIGIFNDEKLANFKNLMNV